MSTGSSLHQRPFDLDENDFFENPEPRCPCILLLDISQSMSGEPIKQLNEAVRALKQSLLEDDYASKRAEIAVVTFGAKVETTSFVSPEKFDPPVFEAKGTTPMGQAIRTSLQMLRDRKALLRDNGMQILRPLIFLISDGSPTDSWVDIPALIRDGEENKSFMLTAIGVKDADFAVLNELMHKKGKGQRREALRLDGLKFKELFQWLSASIKSASHAAPGNEPEFDSPTGWAVS